MIPEQAGGLFSPLDTDIRCIEDSYLSIIAHIVFGPLYICKSDFFP